MSVPHRFEQSVMLLTDRPVLAGTSPPHTATSETYHSQLALQVNQLIRQPRRRKRLGPSAAAAAVTVITFEHIR